MKLFLLTLCSLVCLNQAYAADEVSASVEGSSSEIQALQTQELPADLQWEELGRMGDHRGGWDRGGRGGGWDRDRDRGGHGRDRWDRDRHRGGDRRGPSFCDRFPLDYSCRGSSAHCSRFPTDMACRGTPEMCRHFPTDPSCRGTREFCRYYPYDMSCRRHR